MSSAIRDRPGGARRACVRDDPNGASPMARCQHYWLLTPPDGDVVRGRCKRCKQERIFPARLDETDRGNDYEDLREPAGAGRGGWHRSLAS